MTRKFRGDSVWNELTDEQWQTLESWLFEENITYREACERLEKEWGLKRSIVNVCRFYKHCARERAVDQMATAMETAQQINNTAISMDELRVATLKVMRRRLFEQSIEANDPKELSTLGRLMNQYEEREIQRGRLALARERWEFKASQAAIKAMPNLNEFAQEEEQRDLARVEAIKRALFGREVDFIEKIPQ